MKKVVPLPVDNKKSSPLIKRIVKTANYLIESSSYLDDKFYINLLERDLRKLFETGSQHDLNLAFDALLPNNEACQELMSTADACAGSITALAETGQEFAFRLLAIPVLITSRFALPLGALQDDWLDTLKVGIKTTLLARDVRLALIDQWLPSEHVPSDHITTYRLLQRIKKQALAEENIRITMPLIAGDHVVDDDLVLSDIRYILCVISAPEGKPLWRWHAGQSTRQVCMQAWDKLLNGMLDKALIGCTYQAVAIDYFHFAVREANLLARPFNLLSVLAFLVNLIDLTELEIVGAFYKDQEYEEVRVSFCQKNQTENVLFGVIWPLYLEEEHYLQAQYEINRLVAEFGFLGKCTWLPYDYMPEYCEDSGMPLYPNYDGDQVLAELWLSDMVTNLGQKLH